MNAASDFLCSSRGNEAGASPASPKPASLRRLLHRTNAFTLLEVLVALAIFALAAIVLGSAYLNILNSYEIVSRSAVTSEDVAFARQIVLAEPDRKKLEDGGEFDAPGGRHVKWTVEIVSTTEADLFTVTFHCDVEDNASTSAQGTT